jgi:hypothetical protein
MIKESFDNNKYTVVFPDDGGLHALRYDARWRDLTGDGLVLAMLFEVNKLRAVVSEVHSWICCACLSTPDDMAQNFERIAAITSPDYEGEP